MPGPYWDVRTCSWQGGAPPQAPPPVLLAVRPAPDPAVAQVPEQTTSAEAQPVAVAGPTG